jgi:copper homeostasis protein
MQPKDIGPRLDMSSVSVEVCAGSVADVAVAALAGADRVELCAALELGGLSPSIGLAETVIEFSPLPVVVMVRPRAGDFLYDRHEFAAMLRDAERFLSLGAAGIVFGILDRSGSIDQSRTRELIDMACPRAAVFHRAFDLVADWRAGIDALSELGCRRILTSGGGQTAQPNAGRLSEMIDTAADRLEIMPGGGIRADNVVEVVRRTHCRQVHTGAVAHVGDGGTISAAHRAVSSDCLCGIMAALREAALRP